MSVFASLLIVKSSTSAKLRSLPVATLRRVSSEPYSFFFPRPGEGELVACRQQLERYSEGERGKAYGDILWALLNSKGFLYSY